MKTKHRFAFFALLIFFAGNAQKPEELLTRWSAKSPIEKVYIHFDRESYIAGETAWFNAYLYSDYQPDTISTTLYIELLNDASLLVTRKTLPIFLSNANGQIELPDSLTTGNYLIRAYTATMMNQDPEFVYRKEIFVYGKKRATATVKQGESKIHFEFFPEGGNLVTGYTNTVAFKATDENGLPVDIKGSIKNDKGEVLTSINSYHDGMGMFDIKPVAKEKYYTELDVKAPPQKYYLPEQTDRGIAMTIIPHPQGSYFEIQQQKDNPVFTAYYMIGQMQHHIVFKQEFKTGLSQLQGVINTLKLNSGILQVTIFNKDGIPLAERLCFVNNKEYIQPVELITDTIDFSSRAKNRFSIMLKDTVRGSISISVLDADYLGLPEREENIFSSLLLTSDLKGYIHSPAWYFKNDDDSIKTAADLLMLTNGWRRFNWTELTKQGIPYKDNAYITLAGKATLRGIKQPFADKQMLLMITGVNKRRSTHLLQTGRDGNFVLDSLIFFDKNWLLFCDVRGKKSQYIDVLLSGDSLHRNFSLPVTAGKPYRYSNASDQARWKMDYDAIARVNGLMLEGVTIKVHKKTPLQELDEKYTSGLFYGDANKVIDLVNNDEAAPYNNIFDYLQSRVNGLQISEDGLDYSIYYRQPTSAVSSLGNIPVTLFLDEVETDASLIASIPANQVALIKLFSTFAGASGNGPGGVLAIYTKKGSDYVGSAGPAAYSVYNGYSVIKEFYAPDYKVPKAANKPDNRITLDWRPGIYFNSVNPTIPFSFYNNDRTSRFKIIVEGMTTDGKLIMLEKTIGKKAF